MPNSQPPASRRTFFLSACVASAALACATWLKKPAQNAVAELPKPAPEKGGGYSLSDHVKQYYKTTRI